MTFQNELKDRVTALEKVLAAHDNGSQNIKKEMTDRLSMMASLMKELEGRVSALEEEMPAKIQAPSPCQLTQANPNHIVNKQLTSFSKKRSFIQKCNETFDAFQKKIHGLQTAVSFLKL